MKHIKDGNCIILCNHISMYYNDITSLSGISIQCKVCDTEYFPGYINKICTICKKPIKVGKLIETGTHIGGPHTPYCYSCYYDKEKNNE